MISIKNTRGKVFIVFPLLAPLPRRLFEAFVFRFVAGKRKRILNEVSNKHRRYYAYVRWDSTNGYAKAVNNNLPYLYNSIVTRLNRANYFTSLVNRTSFRIPDGVLIDLDVVKSKNLKQLTSLSVQFFYRLFPSLRLPSCSSFSTISFTGVR